MTAQGHPRTIFRRAIQRGNLLTAELTVREIGRISLDESLALTALIALKDPRRRSRVAGHWLLRLLEEHKTATIEEAALSAGSPGRHLSRGRLRDAHDYRGTSCVAAAVAARTKARGNARLEARLHASCGQTRRVLA